MKYLFASLLLLPVTLFAQNKAIYSGVPWFDDNGNVVSAHGACIVKDKNRFYLFGERKSDTSNAFTGFNCYSSTDLYNWNFESIALTVQDSGKLGPNRVGERVKVMQCPKTGQYVMYMHTDDLGYRDPTVGYATADKIIGPYVFKGPILFDGKPIRKWDMGTFQDKDGTGYLLIHSGEIYKLSDDYKTAAEQVITKMAAGFESPAIFRKDSIYYWLGSNLTSWERNDNYYYTATSLKGPWTARGLFAPEGTLTWNSQTTFVLPIEGSKGTTYMYMGDRWAFPKQASAATYVWQPLTISGTNISIPSFQQAWQINTATGRAVPHNIGSKIAESFSDPSISYTGQWNHVADTLTESNTDAKNASASLFFKGTQIGVYSVAGPDRGYALFTIRDSHNKAILTQVVDMYCKYRVSTLKFVSPVFPRGGYTLTISPMGERGNWSDKSKKVYGSTGNFISIDKIVFF